MNRLEDLRETLDSYAAGEVLPDQLIVVDQTREHPERVEALVRSYGDIFPAEYVYQATPSSTTARNRGIALAKYGLLLFSDDDVTLEPDTLRRLKTLLAEPTLAMVAGLDRNMVGTRSRLGYLFCKKSWKKRRMGHVAASMLGVFPLLPLEGSCETEWAMGFFFAVRAELVERWALRFDEKLTSYAYAEDLDFSSDYAARAKAAGLRCVMSDQVQVRHRVSNKARTPSRKATMMYVLNRTYLSYKHYPKAPGKRLALGWSLVGDTLLRLLRGGGLKDMLDAQRKSLRHRRELRQGRIDPTWYQDKEQKG